jgi:multimeric flavodoxin WrbA
MALLLIVHHTTSPTLQEMLDAVRVGAERSGSSAEVAAHPALSATASDVLAADAVVLGSPVNIGYVSGALKHFFDTVYYPCLEATSQLRFGYYLHGNDDLAGGVRAVETITKGMGWRQYAAPVLVTGALSASDREELRDLGALMAAVAAGEA